VQAPLPRGERRLGILAIVERHLGDDPGTVELEVAAEKAA
jgi:hypothetical protein